MGTCRPPAAAWLQQSMHRSIRLPAPRDPWATGSVRRGTLWGLGESSSTPGYGRLAVDPGHQRDMSEAVMDKYDLDRRKRIENGQKLLENGNLFYWYERSYCEQFV